MIRKPTILVVSALAVVGMLAAATPARADQVILNVTGIMGTGVTAQVTFNVNSANNVVTITILNNSPVPGIVTGFGFNAPDGLTLDNTTLPAGWSSGSNQTADALGQFDWAGLTGPTLNGGTTASGITIGNFLVFQFDFSGSGATTGTFLSLLSTGGGNGARNFVVRFQSVGSSGQLSDFAADGDGVVPEPGSMLLIGSGLVAVGGILRRRRKT